MNIQAALEQPRFTVPGNKLSCDIVIESRVAPDVLQALRGKGHKLIVRGKYTSLMGRGQAVVQVPDATISFVQGVGMYFGASGSLVLSNRQP